MNVQKTEEIILIKEKNNEHQTNIINNYCREIEELSEQINFYKNENQSLNDRFTEMDKVFYHQYTELSEKYLDQVNEINTLMSEIKKKDNDLDELNFKIVQFNIQV